jgi:hypothetical protein
MARYTQQWEERAAPLSDLLDQSLVEAVACSGAGVVVLIHVGCVLQSIMDAWTDIFGSDVELEFRLFHELGGCSLAP